MKFTKSFSEITKNDSVSAGGKGASLGEMTQAGLPVPPGFVILANAFDSFIKETNLNVEIDTILHTVRQEVMHTIEDASEKITGLITYAIMPQDVVTEIMAAFANLQASRVAVRSSATVEDSQAAAWAGQLDSFLNITETQLLEHVKKCWASLFTPRAIFYRIEKSLHDQPVSVAVVVQKMVDSEISGVAFSVHPVTQDQNQIIIEAGFGLGEALVAGKITPDSYVIEKNPRRIIDKNIHVTEKQLLDDEEILELSDLVLQIENHYDFPVDIEWANENGTFWIVQSRPITTLLNAEKLKPIYQKIFARDFCLASIEIWCKGESTNPRQWTEKQQPKKPYIIFEHTEETVNCFMDMDGVAWIKQELTALLKQNPQFVEFAIQKFYKKIEPLKPIWEEETVLNHNELVVFLNQSMDAWPWFEAIWWLMELLVDDQQKFTMLQKARKITELEGVGSDVVMRKSLEHIFPTLGKLSSVSLIEEIVSKKIPAPEILQQRMRGYVYTDDTLFVNQSVEDVARMYGIIIEHTPIESSTEHELRGEIAYPGFVRGSVKRIMGRDTTHRLQEHEILVTSMTTPDLLPAMKRAGAFITDEGGVTCHAAIVARELKKPCIIGTKIATAVLRDGDEVEVDARRGIVRVLKRA